MKLCQRCGKVEAVPQERFCKRCKGIILRDGRIAHPEPREAKHSDQRGRGGLSPRRSMDVTDALDIDTES